MFLLGVCAGQIEHKCKLAQSTVSDHLRVTTITQIAEAGRQPISRHFQQARHPFQEPGKVLKTHVIAKP